MAKRAAFLGRLMLILAVTAPLGAADQDHAAQWPQWRGPHRDGVSAEQGLLQRWGKSGPSLAWKTSGLGGGFASVAIADGKAYTMGQRDGKEYVIALDVVDEGHRQAWATPIGQGDNNSGTPTVDGDRVYAIGPFGDVVCLQASDGKIVWQKSFTRDFGGSVPTWKYCESPLVDGDKLICTPGGSKATLVALDKKTGELIWQCGVPSGAGSGSGYSSVVVSEGAGVRQYVQLMGAGTGCIGVDARDGKLLWNYPRVANGTASIPTPIVRGDYVFCSSGYGTGSALLKLSKSDGGVKAEEVYFLNANTLQNHHGGLVLLGDYIYGGHGHNDGRPVCVELKTGKIRWGGKQRGPGSESAAVVCADGQLYFRYQNGLMALISASPKGYHLNGTFQIPDVAGPSWSHPVVADGRLYLREQDRLLVYDVHKK